MADSITEPTRLTPSSFDFSPCDIDPLPDFNAAAECADRDNDCRAAAPWSRADVFAYICALREMGFSSDEVARQVAKDCGAEYAHLAAEPGSLMRRQAGG